jgi:hypothetical protein
LTRWRAASSEGPLAFQQAAERLAALDSEQVGLVLGAVVRSLPEESQPAGLTGEDMQEALVRPVSAATGGPRTASAPT